MLFQCKNAIDKISFDHFLWHYTRVQLLNCITSALHIEHHLQYCYAVLTPDIRCRDSVSSNDQPFEQNLPQAVAAMIGDMQNKRLFLRRKNDFSSVVAATGAGKHFARQSSLQPAVATTASCEHDIRER